jgi:hypothetical protein
MDEEFCPCCTASRMLGRTLSTVERELVLLGANLAAARQELLIADMDTMEAEADALGGDE